MKTSLKKFRSEFTEEVLNFIWRQWCQMGVAGSIRRGDRWVIDPESLLAFTTEIARYDARMFDEVLDWLSRNGHWINTQRLSTLLKQDNVGDKSVVGAIASWMTEKDKSMKWRGLARRLMSDDRQPEESLFRSRSEKAIAGVEFPDPRFQRYGLLREQVLTRGMTQPVNMKDPANVMFKSRALFGIGIRADVMVYLVTTEGAHSRRIAELLGYNPMRVQEVLVGLAEAAFVSVRSVGRTKQYWIDRDRWWPVLMGGHSAVPRWVNWRALMRGLTAIWREAWSIDESRSDDDIFSTKMRSAMRVARDDLHGSGIGVEIDDDRGYVAENYLPVFLRNVNNILSAMSEKRNGRLKISLQR